MGFKFLLLNLRRNKAWTFYDRNGKPIAYTEDDEYIFLFTGEPVAYLYDNTVYGYNGRQFGWFENGWVRDLHGSCVFLLKMQLDQDR